MPDPRSKLAFLRSKPPLVVALLLGVEIILFYALPTKEYVPSPPPLDLFATTVGPWTMIREYPLAPDAEALLKADDTLTRDYRGPGAVELFVAFFKSQRAGVTPHSPKMCLPANGWEEEAASIVPVKVPGETKPIPVNRYIVMKDDHRDLVFYWFQNWHRATADEYISRLFLIYDSLRYRRSDEALIRVVTPIDGEGNSAAEQNALEFLRAIYQPLKQQIWSTPASASVVP